MYTNIQPHKHSTTHTCKALASLWTFSILNFSTQAFNMETNLTWNICFDGFTRLSINVPVHGEISSIQLINDTEPTVMLIEGTEYVVCKSK